MNPTTGAVRAGLARGLVEFRHAFTGFQELWGIFFFPVVLLVVVAFMRGGTVPGTEFSLGTMALPSILGMFIAFGLVNVAAVLIIDREDGTLLRAKAIPDGMLAYLLAKVVSVTGSVLVSMLVFLIPGLFLVESVAGNGIAGWAHFAGIFVLGMLAVLPIGAVLGSLFDSPRNLGFVMMPMMALIGISGVFYPITQLPTVVQGIAQVFPIYWLGLGTRAALLPDAMAVVEIGESWRHLETVGVLGAWALVGLVVAPFVLRRMARRESGSAVAARREQAMQRV